MASEQKTVVRSITLLKMLAQSPESFAYFVKIFDVDVRTIRRDIRKLQVVGFPIVLNRSFRRLELVSDFGVPELKLSERETLATVSLYQFMGRRRDDPFFSAFQSAAAKIVSSTPPVVLEALETSFAKITFRDGARDVDATPKTEANDEKAASFSTLECDSDAEAKEWKRRRKENAQKFETVLGAAVRERPLAIRYKGPLFPELETTFHPYALFFARAWYAVGFSELHCEVRTFKISRFISIEESNENFRGNDAFSLEAYFGLAWRFIRGSRIWRVVVRFSPKVGANVAEVCWHKSQQTRFFEDGTAELTFDVAGLSEIIWWVLGYGAEAEVVEPQELRNAVLDVAEKMVEIYAADR